MGDTRSVTISRIAETAPFEVEGGAGRSKLEVPEELGPVKLLRPLGEGGMGVVWLGRHQLLGREVAVKFLLDVPRSGDDPNFTAFLQGAKAAAALRHSGLNEVHHADVTGGVPYLVMEYIDGPSLSEVVKRQVGADGAGPGLSLRAVRAVLRGVCEAVAALHEHEVIHRDIKPANIMLTRDGRVVVTDFGLACPRPTALFGASTGALAGSPAYMAPEMFEGIVSARTDVYAIGCTAHQLLTGRAPFDGTVGEVRAAHKSAPIDVPALLKRGVPEGVAEAVERAVNKNVLFRPKSARQALDMFEEAFVRAGVGLAGSEELARLARGEAGEAEATSFSVGSKGRAEATPSGTYYDALSTLASGRRRTEDLTPRAPAPMVGEIGGELEAAAPIPAPPEPAPIPPARRAWHPALAALAAGVAGGAAFWALNQVLVPLDNRMSLFLYTLSERNGWLVGTERSVAPGGRTFIGELPTWVSALHTGEQLVVLLGPGLLLSIWLVRFLAQCGPRQLGKPTTCGWCGYALQGVLEARCPECGHGIGEAWPDAAGRRPPGAAIMADLRATAAALVALLLVMFAFTVVKSSLAMAAVFPGFVAAALAYHALSRSTMHLRGITWCGGCGRELKGLKAPECTGCGARL